MECVRQTSRQLQGVFVYRLRLFSFVLSSDLYCPHLAKCSMCSALEALGVFPQARGKSTDRLVNTAYTLYLRPTPGVAPRTPTIATGYS
eukprot:scaffold11768_cov88-Skeletonema_dohrnii-CCMP3373.AAC.2